MNISEDALHKLTVRYNFGVRLSMCVEEKKTIYMVSLLGFLFAVCDRYPAVQLLRAPELVGRCPHYTQKFHFILRTPKQAVCIIHGDYPAQITSFADILLGCDIAAECFKLDVVYGLLYSVDQPSIFIRTDGYIVEKDHAMGFEQITGKLLGILARE